MKKKLFILSFSCCLAGSFLPIIAYSQQTEIQQLMLNVEKLNQFRQILSSMYKGYNILVEGYTKIREITSGNYKLHQLFLDGLLSVSPAVRGYKRITDIISSQMAIVKEYKSGYRSLQESNQFSQAELVRVYAVYQNLINQSTQLLDELIMIITSGTLRMSDSERLSGIDRILESMDEKLSFLRDFNRQNGFMAVQRARESKDINTIRQLYNIK